MTDENRIKLLEERVDDLAQLAVRVEELEDGRNTLIDEVKDIMTAFENRVLKEIENLTEARIEPIDKISSGLMLTVADLTASLTALLDMYSEDSEDKDYDFGARFSELKKTYHTNMLKSMKESHGLSETPTPKKDSNTPPNRSAKGK